MLILILLLLMLLPFRIWAWGVAKKMGIEKAPQQELKNFYWPLFRKMAWRGFLTLLPFAVLMALGGQNALEAGSFFWGTIGLFPLMLLELLLVCRLPISKARKAHRTLSQQTSLGSQPEAAGSKPMERIAELQILLNAGQITPDEFSEHKVRILKNI